MKNAMIKLCIMAALAGILAGCNSRAAAPTEVPIVTGSSDITAEAVVEPAEWSDVTYAVSGTAVEVLVKEGDLVTKDQVLARLDNVHQAAAVAQAEAGLRRAQAGLEQLTAGARSQEIDIAQAAVDATQAQLDRLQQGARAVEIAPAEAALVVAQASLQKLLDGASEDAIIAASAEYSNTVAALEQAQSAYDRVQDDPGIGARPESLRLQQATNAFEAAQARLDDIKRGAGEADIAIARGQVQQAQAQVDALRAPAREADIAAAQAELHRAQAQLSLVKAGAASEAISAAEAEVAAAQAGLEQARAALNDLELRAPMTGTLTTVDLEVGGLVAPGKPIFVLATLDWFYVRTTDLTELDVARVEIGQKTVVTIDALPGREFEAVVREVALQAKNNQGDVVYDVTVELTDPEVVKLLRWGMTAQVRIPVE